MIKHIVLFKLTDNSPAVLAKTKEVLLSMQGAVPMLRGLEVGCDFLHSPRSYDIALLVTLDDALALDAYQNDPYHCSVVKEYIHKITASSVSLDYTI